MSSPNSFNNHPNNNLEILCKPNVKVWSDNKSDNTPIQTKTHRDNTVIPPSASANLVLSTCSETRKDRFGCSSLPVDQNALVYTTLDSRPLVWKLACLPYKYKGGSDPIFKLGEADSSYGLCNHCGKWHWSCHELSLRKFCNKDALR